MTRHTEALGWRADARRQTGPNSNEAEQGNETGQGNEAGQGRAGQGKEAGQGNGAGQSKGAVPLEVGRNMQLTVGLDRITGI